MTSERSFSDIKLYHSRFEVLRYERPELNLEGSAALVFTDPPYQASWSRAYENWTALGKFAAFVLRPKGLLVCLMPNPYARLAWTGLTQSLDYFGLLTISLPRGGNRTLNDKMGWAEYHRPAMVLSKGIIPEPTPWRDVPTLVEAPPDEQAHDQDYHRWGQNIKPFLTWIGAFTQPGDLVIDPCLGGGTTAAACLRLGRRFIGCDIDPEAVRATQEHLADTELAMAMGES